MRSSRKLKHLVTGFPLPAIALGGLRFAVRPVVTWPQMPLERMDRLQYLVLLSLFVLHIVEFGVFVLLRVPGLAFV